jgi:hypothetical protein
MRSAYPFQRHKVVDFGNSLLGEEARYQDVGIWEIELLVPHLVEDGMNFETTTFVLVEQAGEDCR